MFCVLGRDLCDPQPPAITSIVELEGRRAGHSYLPLCISEPQTTMDVAESLGFGDGERSMWGFSKENI